MFQVTTVTTGEDAQTVNQAIQFGAIAFNILLMLLVEGAIVTAFALKSIKTPVSAKDWFSANWFRFLLGIVLSCILAVLVVVAPDIGAVLQTIGFNIDKSPIALGLTIGLILVGATAEPSENPEGK
jgi:hypothetical protein